MCEQVQHTYQFGPTQKIKKDQFQYIYTYDRIIKLMYLTNLLGQSFQFHSKYRKAKFYNKEHLWHKWYHYLWLAIFMMANFVDDPLFWVHSLRYFTPQLFFFPSVISGDQSLSAQDKLLSLADHLSIAT